jgi:hypothetical protein
LAIGVAHDDELGFIDRVEDRADGCAIRLAEYIVADVDIAWLRARVDHPDEDVVAHWLWVWIGTAGGRLSLHAEPTAASEARIVLEGDFPRGFPALIGCQTAIAEQVVPEDDPLRNVPGLPALMCDASIVDVVEEAALNDDIAGAVPELDPIAEADAVLPMPDSSADETEVAAANDDVVGVVLLVAVHTRVAEGQILQNDMTLPAGQPAVAPQHTLDVPPGKAWVGCRTEIETALA